VKIDPKRGRRKKENRKKKRDLFSRLPRGGLVLVTIQGRVPFRRRHMNLRARLGSRARGSYSCHKRPLRRIRRGGDCGWCGRGGCWRCRSGTGGQAGGVPIRGGLPSPKIGAAACGSRIAPSWVSCPGSRYSSRWLVRSLSSRRCARRRMTFRQMRQ